VRDEARERDAVQPGNEVDAPEKIAPRLVHR
jgi:hypothetical protein